MMGAHKIGIAIKFFRKRRIYMMSKSILKIGIHPLQCNEDIFKDLDSDKLDIDRWENDGGSSLLII